MPRFAANLSMMFTEVPFLDRFEAAAKAGFTAEGTARKYLRINGEWQDHLLFAIIAGDTVPGSKQ